MKTIPQKIKKKVPDCLQLFTEIESQYEEILQHKKNEISPYGPAIPSNELIYKCKILEQFCLHRTCDFLETVFNSWDKNRPAVAFVLDRAIMETNALLFYLQDKINAIIENEDDYMEKLYEQIDELNLLTTKMILGNRFDDQAKHQAANILSIT